MQALGSDFQDFLDLLIPVSPIVIPGKFPIFVWDFFIAQQDGELLIEIDQKIFSATVEIEVRQRRYARRRCTAYHLVNVIRLARFRSGWAIHAQQGIPNRRYTLQVWFGPRGRCQRAT